MVSKSPKLVKITDQIWKICFKIVKCCQKYKDPFMMGDLEIYNTNIKNESFF